jgi:hypothetical protein
MTVYATCHGCTFKGDCRALTLLKKQIAGLGVTTVRHRCALRVPQFLPGDPVIVKTGTQGEGEYGPVWCLSEFPGTFIQEERKGARVICFIKPGTEGTTGDEFEPVNGKDGFVKVSRSRIRKGQSERMELKECPGCGGLPSLTGKCGHSGSELYRPEVCVMKKAAAA